MMKTLSKYILLFSLGIAAQPHATSASLSADIESLLATPMKKGPVETADEYELRSRNKIEEFTNRTYRFEIGIENIENDQSKLLHFDPDSEEMEISLPRLNKTLVWVLSNGERKINFVRFINAVPSKINSETYTGVNGFGAQVKIQKVSVVDKGIAILHGEGSRSKSQSFRFKATRDTAKSLLAQSKLVLNVRSELRRYEDPPSMLIIDEEEIEPKMSRPIHYIKKKYILPVRLISLTLYDRKGQEVLKAEGTQIDTNPYEK